MPQKIAHALPVCIIAHVRFACTRWLLSPDFMATIILYLHIMWHILRHKMEIEQETKDRYYFVENIKIELGHVN